jgi:PAS domain S-box-containing protein
VRGPGAQRLSRPSRWVSVSAVTGGGSRTQQCDTDCGEADGPTNATPIAQPDVTSRTEQPAGDIAVELLLEAGAVLASSLDVSTTIDQVARLIVPGLADLCVIDLRDDDGSIRKAAAAAADERIARGLEDMRARYPVDPGGEHPVARVIRSGEAELLAEMSSARLRGFAQGAEHAQFMIEHDYRSAVVAPLLARGRTLGALSLLRLGDCEPYGAEELELGGELARRAALAIDNASLFSDLRRVEQRLEAILANLAEAITVEDEHGQTVFANRAAADLLGLATTGELMSASPAAIRGRFLIYDQHGRELDLRDLPGRHVFAGERPDPLLVRHIVRATGEERWLMVRSSPITDAQTGRVLYAANVLENITEVKRAQLAESFMAEASRTLASSMDYAETLQRVARLAVPQIAEWCVVDLIDEHGELQRVAIHHTDPEKLALAERLSRTYRPALDEASGIAEVIRTGQPRIFSEIRPDALAERARDSEHLTLLDAIGATSAVIVPLAAPARTIGAITLISSQSGRRLTDADLGLAVRLGRRCGTAVESARLYTERTRIARILESSLLPESLPEIPGVELAALYRAAGELNDVGGDFYDVFAYDADRWMLVIGDVCGKGPRAAGVTALARHTLRAAATLGQSPTGMLSTLHAALRRQPVGADMCTAALVTLGHLGGRAQLTVALAGHPPPVIVDASGEPRQIGQAGTLLGVLDPIDITEVDAELHPSETLLLYTDGVPEASGPGEQAESALFEACAGAQHLTIPALLERVVDMAAAHSEQRLRDDIALIGVRLSDSGLPAEETRARVATPAC